MKIPIIEVEPKQKEELKDRTQLDLWLKQLRISCLDTSQNFKLRALAAKMDVGLLMNASIMIVFHYHRKYSP